MDPIFVPSSPEEGSETKRTEAHGRKKWIPFLSRLHPGGGGRKNEARRRRMVGVDALGDPSCANMKQKPCGFHEAPALRASVGASPKDVSSTIRSEIATKAVSSHHRWNETGGSKRIPF